MKIARRLWLLAVLAACGQPSEPVSRPVPCRFGTPICASRVEIAEDVHLPIFTTHLLDVTHPDVTAGVIVVHGAGRDADNYFETMVLATQQSERLVRETVIVAPHFQTESDGPAANEARWSSEGWKRGHLSVTGGPVPRVSSYTAIDRIVERMANPDRFPALARIVVTGHSAGGQVTHRYAAGSRVENQLPGIPVRYVVANPSTYLYLGTQRAAGQGFAVPNVAACPNYNEWHYGLDGLNTYMSAVPIPAIRAQLAGRDVVIMVGDQDVGDAQLDQSCGANLQGPNRYQRGLTLVRYMDAFFPGHQHVQVIVPGVAHSSRGMYTSEQGLEVLFGNGSLAQPGEGEGAAELDERET